MLTKKITEEDLTNIVPNTSSVILATKSVKYKEKYIYLYNLYRKLLSEYLIDKLSLENYDRMIYESQLNFGRVLVEKMDLYQYFTSERLNYYYIRNNIYIENLSDEEMSFLINYANNGDKPNSEEINRFIEDTYRKVIIEDFLKNGQRCMIQYGPNSSNFFSRNDSIVIGFRYDIFSDDSMDDNDWFELNNRQMEFLLKLHKKMQKDLESKVDVPISIIQYDDDSVKTLKNSEIKEQFVK